MKIHTKQGKIDIKTFAEDGKTPKSISEYAEHDKTVMNKYGDLLLVL